MQVVLELHAQCLVAFGTSRLRVAVTGVTVLGLFGSSSLGNFQFGF